MRFESSRCSILHTFAPRGIITKKFPRRINSIRRAGFQESSVLLHFSREGQGSDGGSRGEVPGRKPSPFLSRALEVTAVKHDYRSVVRGKQGEGGIKIQELTGDYMQSMYHVAT